MYIYIYKGQLYMYMNEGQLPVVITVYTSMCTVLDTFNLH